MNSSYQSKKRGSDRYLVRHVNRETSIHSESVVEKPADEAVRYDASYSNHPLNWKAEERNLSSTIVKARKPNEGTFGETIHVLTNHFPVTTPTFGRIYQYHMEVKSRENISIPHPRLWFIYENWLTTICKMYPSIEPHRMIFDRDKKIYTYEQILFEDNNGSHTTQIMAPDRYSRYVHYDITVKQVGKAFNYSSIEDQEHIKHVLSLVLHQQCLSNADYIINRTYFIRPSPNDGYGEWDLGLGRAMWKGFFSCLTSDNSDHQRLLINLDINHGVFIRKQSFLDYISELISHAPCQKIHHNHRSRAKIGMTEVVQFFKRNNQLDIDFVLEYCRNLTVQSHVSDKPIRYKIHSFAEPASSQTFSWNGNNNQLVTIVDYYNKRYGIQLEYPSLPTLKMHKDAFVPMELVDVIPFKTKKITNEQRAKLCLKSTLTPEMFSRAIQEVRADPKKQCFHKDPFVQAWQLNVDESYLEVVARVLPPPKLIYNQREFQIPRSRLSSAITNNIRQQFFKPTKFPIVWALINLSSSMNEQLSRNFYEELRTAASKYHMDCCPPFIYEELNRNQSIDVVLNALKCMMIKNSNCKFFIVILPDDDRIRDEAYRKIKDLCESRNGFGIASQMVRNRTNARSQFQWHSSTLDNLLMKINTKLDGINARLSVNRMIENFFARGHRIMYVGIDLSHGPPGRLRRYSTVAVVASADDIPNRYFKEIYFQERSEQARKSSWEFIVDMKNIMKSLITQYEQHHHYPPSSIIIYRDGISKSEFDTVFVHELTAIREACIELSTRYQPLLTYIVANKNHHTKLMLPDYTNCPQGSVFDSPRITDAKIFDFFLKSHGSSKGTSRSTYYCVLYDDNNLTADQGEMLTNALCYTSARSRRSISIPAPVQYADLLAARAWCYIDTNTLLKSVPDTAGNNKTTKSRKIFLNPNLEPDLPFFI